MSSSSSEEDAQREEDNGDDQGLEPYQYEPEADHEVAAAEHQEDEVDERERRLGNSDW